MTEQKKLTPVDLDAYVEYIYSLQKRVKELEEALKQFGPINYPLMEIWDTAHSLFYVAGDNVEVQRLAQKIAQEVDKAQKYMRDVLKGV